MTISSQEEKFYWTGLHELHVQWAIKRLLQPGQDFWDVGAHVGFFAVIASRLVGHRGQVHCFEPMKDSRDRLQEAVRANNLTNVVVWDFAVGSFNGHSVLYPHARSAMWGLYDHEDRGTGVPVRVRSLDDIAGGLRPPHVIKVDVEGAELEVLRGGAQFLREVRPLIIVEFSNEKTLVEARKEFSFYGFEPLGANHWLLRPAVSADLE